MSSSTAIFFDWRDRVVLTRPTITAPIAWTIASPTLQRLQHHKTVLETAGITDLGALGHLGLSGAVVPQVGITVPSKNPYERQTAFQWAYKISNVGTGLVKVGGMANVLRAAPLPPIMRSSPSHVPGTGRRVPLAGPITSTEMVDAYIAAETLELADDTLIVLKYPNRYLTIIAERIVVGRNVMITWDRPLLCKPEKPSPSSENKKKWSNPAPTPDGLWGVTGEVGDPGIKGFEDRRPSGIKGVLDGLDAPEIELWTLQMQGCPLIDVHGQDGAQGGPGGDGWDGQDGSKGRDAIWHMWGLFVDCKSGPGNGGDGGPGGKAGDGGAGGNGGHGGRFALYAPQHVLSAFAQGFFASVDGGAGGPGGFPGVPGSGGAGGQVGDNPKNCATSSPRMAGKPGTQGAPGEPGPSGSSGERYPDAIRLNVIDTDEFRHRLLAPAVTGLEPQEASQGQSVRIFGLRFTPTDELLVDDVPVAKQHISDTEMRFLVPAVEGGRKDILVRQTDGTLSNKNTLAVLPVIDGLQSGNRVRPGSVVRLKGSGFSRTALITANGLPVSDVRFIDANALEFVLVRPSNVQLNPAGETVTLQVLVPEVKPSNGLDITLDTVRMMVFGDSVMWGQGLTESQKIHSLVVETIRQREGNIGVYVDLRAHSGAIVGADNGDTADRLDGEVPTDFPTILQQVAEVSPAPETVDLVLLNGGINDVDVRRILNPTVDEAQLLALIEQYCYADIKTLLDEVTNRFPAARVVVSGYYPMFSDDSDLALMTVFLTFIGLPLASIPGALAGAIISELFKAAVVRRAFLFAKEAEKRLQRAIDEINQKWIDQGAPARRVFLAQPDFDRQNAALASQPWIFGLGPTGWPEDNLVAPSRAIACDSASSDRVENVEFCKRASMCHPNEHGARAYAREILAVLSEGSFPPSFLWGVATAGYQVEGDIENNDWHIFTTSPGIHSRVQQLAAADDFSIDLIPPGEAIRHGDLPALAEDLDRAKVLGLNAYRFSIEWSRIQPSRDTFDPSAFAYYDSVLAELRKRDLKPIVTLNHLTLPAWVLTPPRAGWGVAVEDDGFRSSLRGWENEETVDAFFAFVNAVVERYRDQVDTWITLNEPVGSMIGVGYFAGIWPPGFTGDGNRGKLAYFNLLKAHVRAYRAIKSIYGTQPSQVGVAHNIMYARLTTAGGGIGDINEAAKNQFDYFYSWHFLDSLIEPSVDRAIQRRSEYRDNVASSEFYGFDEDESWTPQLDFIGLNYYRSVYVYYDAAVALTAGYSGGRFKNNLSSSAAEEHNLLNPLGWEIYPKGLYWILKRLHEAYGLPILITENGIPQAADHNRAPFIVAHLDHVLRAIEEGVRVTGYLHWSIVDNFEWHENYLPSSKFGLFTVDRESADASGKKLLHRHITEGALAIQHIIAEGSLRQAAEKFGYITPRAYAVSPPTKSPSAVWEGATDAGTGISLYLSWLSSGQILGTIFFQDADRWHRLENIRWEVGRLRFDFSLPDGTPVQSEATPAGREFTGTFTGFGQPRSWRATRVILHGNWTSTRHFPRQISLQRLEGDFGGWQGKYQAVYPFQTWASSEFLTWDGSSLRFGIGNFGTFNGSLTASLSILGEIALVGGGGGATMAWEARRLPDDLPF